MKRARWDGAEPVLVFDPQGTVYDSPIAQVEPGHHLPEQVPARIRDELTARDNWTEIDYTPPGKKDEE
jgi:hypothetical protein